MSNFMGFARKKGDSWTPQEVKRISDFILEYRALVEVQKFTKTDAQAVIINKLRNKYLDWTEERRGDGSLAKRIDFLDKVMAGEIEESKVPYYDKDFYNTEPRSNSY